MNSKKPRSTTHYIDKVTSLNRQLINVIKRHVKKYGDPHIYLHEDDEVSFEFDTDKFVYCLQETLFLDDYSIAHDYEKLNSDQLAILADYVTNL